MKDRVKLNNKKSRLTKFNIPADVDTVAELIALMSDGIYNDSDPNNATTGDNVGVSDIGTPLNKSHLDPLTFTPFTHARSGTTHSLANIEGGVNIWFVATADYVEGDTFSVNETAVTAQTNNGEPLSDGDFVVGAVVIAILNDGVLSFISCSRSKKMFTAALTTAWTGDAAPYTQVVSVPGMTADDKPDIGVVYDADNATAIAQREAWACVCDADSGADTLTFVCFEDKPAIAIPIQIKVVR